MMDFSTVVLAILGAVLMVAGIVTVQRARRGKISVLGILTALFGMSLAFAQFPAAMG